MSTKHQLALSAETNSLPEIQRFMDTVCQEARLDDETSYDLKLAVEEACLNIIDHSYVGMDPGSIIVSFQYGKRQAVVRITDFGFPFEPQDRPQPDPEAALTGTTEGFGLYFIYRSVDSVDYESTESCNTLTFVKAFKPG